MTNTEHKIQRERVRASLLGGVPDHRPRRAIGALSGRASLLRAVAIAPASGTLVTADVRSNQLPSPAPADVADMPLEPTQPMAVSQ
jgi:hypothetical protein